VDSDKKSSFFSGRTGSEFRTVTDLRKRVL